MRKRQLWRYGQSIALMLTAIIGGAQITSAETSTSPHYQATGLDFNAVSSSQNCSGQYCAVVSLGTTDSGDSKSANSSATFGPVTGSQPLLEVITDPGVSDLGVLTTERTATKTTTIKVRTYLSSGYIMQIVGAPPKYGNHTLAALTSPTASSPGTEQFGINAVANTTPSVGADVVQVPSGEFSFGVLNDDYKTPNKFKYIDGDTVAHSNSTSGETDYTISMIVNISGKTPAGHYSGDYAAVVTPVY